MEETRIGLDQAKEAKCPMCNGTGEGVETTNLPMFACSPTCFVCLGSGKIDADKIADSASPKPKS